jgi:hypothetical protein
VFLSTIFWYIQHVKFQSETLEMSDLDISGLDKAELLAGLYNRSKPLGLGFLEATQEDMTVDEARRIIQQQGPRFDYLNGRVMKIDLGGDTLNPRGFDRDNGAGATQSVVQAIRVGQQPPANRASLAGELEKTIACAKPSTVTKQGAVARCDVGIGAELVRALEARRSVFRPSAGKKAPEQPFG